MKLTAPQREVLRALAGERPSYRIRQWSTVAALLRRGLIARNDDIRGDYVITGSGRDALRAAAPSSQERATARAPRGEHGQP